MQAGEDSPGGLGHPPSTPRPRRRRAPLINQRDRDPGRLGLVAQRGDQVPDPPSADPLVMPPPGVQTEHAARVTDRQRPDLLPDGPPNDRLSSFMLGLPHPPPVTRLDRPMAAPVGPPPPRPALPRLRCPPCHRGGAGCAVAQVLPTLGADRPPRHQQHLPIGPGRRVRVDHPQVHPRNPPPIRFFLLGVYGDRYLGGDIHIEPCCLTQQGDAADLFGRVGQVPVQPHNQRRAAPRHRQPHHLALKGERARIPAHRHQRPPTPREPRGLVALLAALGRGKPGIGIPAQNRPGPRGVQLPEGARARGSQLPAQLLVARQRRILPTTPPGVQLQHAAPHIPRGPQQPEQPPPLPPGDAQPTPSGPVHHARRTGRTLPGHAASKPAPCDKTTQRHPRPARPRSHRRSYGQRH